MRHNIHNLAHILRYLMVRLQPGVLDIETDDVGFAGKLLEASSADLTPHLC